MSRFAVTENSKMRAPYWYEEPERQAGPTGNGSTFNQGAGQVDTKRSLLQWCSAKLWGRPGIGPAARDVPACRNILAEDNSDRLITSLRTAYPGARISSVGGYKVRLELPSGDVLSFYVNT